ncbi:hypothetical protein PPL_10267 [Heterostelium album PN500]|uniref:EGF-like domain-containing protein n=1 Tax=Heterostelium pallidum (strain ATCC 26659 / Pp 5 / PN500) TaxID=670386 RepID=D3BQS9_HETP5|nr:hypothetical protein PPL_10267 [Heterostelium album PN500]EFA76499.1 hypothetical protein PPL_10267 [Heterostelium album PN500]|eukprot:XP_020428631.1 hypothetical protein PPL_10267 [Heterostelium album PN500]
MDNEANFICLTNDKGVDYIESIKLYDGKIVDYGEPGYVEKLTFHNMSSFDIYSSVNQKNNSYNVLELLDNPDNVALSSFIVETDFQFPVAFPNYLTVKSFIFKGASLSSNIPTSLFTPSIEVFMFEVANYNKSLTIGFNSQNSYPNLKNISIRNANLSSFDFMIDSTHYPKLTQFTVYQYTVEFKQYPTSLVEMYLQFSDIQLSDFTVFPNLYTLDISYCNCTLEKVNNLKSLRIASMNANIPEKTWFQNGFDLTIINSTMSGFFGDFGILNPSKIHIAASLNISTNLYQSNCYTDYTAYNTVLVSPDVPDCFYCYYTEMIPRLPVNTPQPPPNFKCPIKLDKVNFEFQTGKPLIFTGENLGFGIDTTLPLILIVPNKKFAYQYSYYPAKNNGNTNISFSNAYNYDYHIQWGLPSEILYTQSFPIAKSNDTRLVIVGNLNPYYFPWNIYGDGKPCIINGNFTYQVDCTIKGYQSQTPITVEIMSAISNTSTISAVPLVITSVSNITNNGGNITIQGNFGVNPYLPSVRVALDSYLGYIYFSNETTLLVKIRAGYPISKQNISITSNGYFIATEFYILAPPDDCGPNSACNNNGICVQARCQCFKGYNGFYCESKIDDGVIILPNDQTPSPTVVTQDGLQFKFNIVAVQELDETGTVLKEVLTNKWNYSTTSNETYTTHNYTIKPYASFQTIIQAVIDYSSMERTIQFAGLTTVYQAHSLKLLINIKYWQFDSPLNSIRVVMESDFQVGEDDCKELSQEIGTDSITNNLKFIKLSFGGTSYYGRFLPFAMSDRRFVAVDNRLINMTTINNTTESYIGMTLPACSQLCTIDPDFSLLLDNDYDEGTCGKEKSKAWMIATIVSVVGVAFIGAAIATVIYLKKRAKVKNEDSKLEQKLNKLKNNT